MAEGTLVCFGVTEDQAGTIALVAPGTLQVPFTPVNGQLVVVPPGNISLVVGAAIRRRTWISFQMRPDLHPAATYPSARVAIPLS